MPFFITFLNLKHPVLGDDDYTFKNFNPFNEASLGGALVSLETIEICKLGIYICNPQISCLEDCYS